MRRALFLAETKTRYTSPNPKVGAVLVRGGRIVGEGATQPYGGPHAEIVALRMAGAKAKGSTLYVTLEPCAHFGKTPPCVDSILRAGVKKVVAAMRDPYPLVKGRGFQRLRGAGLTVRVGLLEREAAALNQSFIRGLSAGRPWVLLKAAVSAEGKISPPTGRSRWITGEKARRRVHEIRSKVDAILVGRKTAGKDDPSLTVRLPGYRRKDGWPLRVVLDSGLSLDLNSRLTDGKARTVVFTGPAPSRTRQKALEKKGILVFQVPLVKKMLSLKAVLKNLSSLQVRTLLVEGGGEVHQSFLRERLVDEFAIFISPRILGPGAKAWLGGDGLEGFLLSPLLKNVKLEQVGPDFILTGQRKG